MSARTEPMQQDFAHGLACVSRYLFESYERQKRIERMLERLDRKMKRMVNRQRRLNRKPYERPEDVIATATNTPPAQQTSPPPSPPQAASGQLVSESVESLTHQLFGRTEDITKFRDDVDDDDDSIDDNGRDSDTDDGDATTAVLSPRDKAMKEYREARQNAANKLAALSPTASQEEDEEENARAIMFAWTRSRNDDEEEDDEDDNSFIVPDDASLEVEAGNGSSEQTPPTLTVSLSAIKSKPQTDPRDWRELLPDHFKAATARRIARRSRLIEFIASSESNKLDGYEAAEENLQKMITHPYYVEALQQRSVYSQFYVMSKGVKYKLWEQLALQYVLGSVQERARGSNAGRCVVVDLPYGHAYAVADSVTIQHASVHPGSSQWRHCVCPYFEPGDSCVKCAMCERALSPAPTSGLTMLIVPRDMAGGKEHRETIGRLGRAIFTNIGYYVARKPHEALVYEAYVNGLNSGTHNEVCHDLYAIGATCRARFEAMASYLETLVYNVYAQCRSMPTRDAHGYSATIAKYEDIIDEAVSKFRERALKTG